MCQTHRPHTRQTAAARARAHAHDGRTESGTGGRAATGGAAEAGATTAARATGQLADTTVAGAPRPLAAAGRSRGCRRLRTPTRTPTTLTPATAARREGTAC